MHPLHYRRVLFCLTRTAGVLGIKQAARSRKEGGLGRLRRLRKLGVLADVGFSSKLDFLSSGRAPTVSIDSFSAGESVKR